MNKHYEELPENKNQLSEIEIDQLANNLWEKIAAKQNQLDRNTQLRLRQKAYAIWSERYPNEKDDDPDCHLETIYSWLLISSLKNHEPYIGYEC